LRWVWLAVAIHTLSNLVVVGAPLLFALADTNAALLQELLVLPVGLVGLALARWGRSSEDRGP
jgi:hypothetical protein